MTLPEPSEYDDRDQEVYGLVLPFVCVASSDGPFEDVSFVAGFQMGRLDAKLAVENLCAMTDMVYASLEAQADLIAMRHGMTMDVLARADEWVHLGFTRRLFDDAPNEVLP